MTVIFNCLAKEANLSGNHFRCKGEQPIRLEWVALNNSDLIN